MELMSRNEWLSVMDDVKSKHSEIAKVIGKGKVALVDLPFYFNVGDMLIHKGTERFFNDYHIDVVYRTAHRVNYSRLREVDVIVLQGGGNFGDLYHRHQQLREDIVSNFPEKKIVCLPQSIHFESEERMISSAKKFKSHNDFHFFVRDEVSYSIGNEFTKNIYLMPDMAHSLHPLIEPCECIESLEGRPVKVLNIERVDKESSYIDRGLSKKPFDWNQIITHYEINVREVLHYLYKFKRLEDKVINNWLMLSDDIVFKSIDYFRSYDLVYTDRLHGFILSTLLGKQVVLNDNSYKKSERYFEAFMSDYPFMIKNESSNLELMSNYK